MAKPKAKFQKIEPVPVPEPEWVGQLRATFPPEHIGQAMLDRVPTGEELGWIGNPIQLQKLTDYYIKNPADYFPLEPMDFGQNIIHDEIFGIPEAQTVTTNETDEEYMARLQIKTMRDARSKHYEIFPGPDDQARGEKEAVLKYIENLGVMNHTDVSDFPIAKFKKNGRIILHRPDINKIFFKLQKEFGVKEGTPSYVKAAELKNLARKIVIPDGQTVAEATAAVDHARERLMHYTERVEQSQRSKVQWEREFQSREKALAEAKERDAQRKDDGDATALRRVVKKGNFSIPKKQPDNGIYFLSKPVKKVFFSKDQATNLIVPFGQFLIHIYPRDGGIRTLVKKGENNILVRRYMHPHVQGPGEGEGSPICFGGVAPAYRAAQKARNVEGMLDTIWDVLQNFEDRGGDGYIPLYEFEEAYKKSLKEGKIKNG